MINLHVGSAVGLLLFVAVASAVLAVAAAITDRADRRAEARRRHPAGRARQEAHSAVPPQSRRNGADDR